MASEEENNMLTSFEIGRCHINSKPFRLKVLLSRIRAVLRRTETSTQLVSTVNLGNLEG